MSTNEKQELEVKFHVPNLPGVIERLISLNANLIQGRTHELNLRFDTPEGELTSTFQVLRLRKDSAVRLTYKGPSKILDGVRARKEIEFTAGNFEAAQDFLEALGYQMIVMYEKYRTIYYLEGAWVMIDEMPFGNFVEVEGETPAIIKDTAQRLNLEWDKRLPVSYVGLFKRVKNVLGLSFRDLSFENFRQITVPDDIFHPTPEEV
ncbi:MAG: class IV adenylate cyclase [Chloroflexota bacterium]